MKEEWVDRCGWIGTAEKIFELKRENENFETLKESEGKANE
jgi:hypothetical protein